MRGLVHAHPHSSAPKNNRDTHLLFSFVSLGGGGAGIILKFGRAKEMDFTNYEQTLKQRSEHQKKGIHSYEHEIALEVSEYVGEPQKFALWLGIVKRVGTAKMVGLLRQMKEKDIRSAKYLMACVKKK